MKITEIKQRLSLSKVLQHYNLKPDKNLRLNCPFHDDKTPSMQVYAETNTVYCFSSNCKTHGTSLDVIDFIMYKENCTKHEAIEKAKSMVNYVSPINPTHPKKSEPKHETLPAPELTTENVSDYREIVSKIFNYFRNGFIMRKDNKARNYLQSRSLDVSKLENLGIAFGYNSAQFHHRSRISEQDMKLCEMAGLLIQSTNGSRTEFSYTPWASHCAVFALCDKQGNITGMYGRSTSESSRNKHYYLKNSTGLFYYPKKDARTLIITESIIDFLSLYQIDEIRNHYDFLPIYGTNRLNGEHIQVLQKLEHLQELIFFLDGDEAGNNATTKYSEELHQLVPQVDITRVETPENEDVNSLLQGHEPELFSHLLRTRILLFSAEEQLKEKKTSLNTANPDKIIYETLTVKIEIWGGIEYGNMHRLRLSVHMENKSTQRSFRDDVNLYSNRSSKAFVQDASEELEISHSELKETINQFTKEVEEYRLQQKERHANANTKEMVQLSPQEHKDAMRILTSEHLVNHLKTAMHKVGLIGERENGLLLFLIFLTRYFNAPLHALVHGSTGSGKTNLLKSILKLVPPESKYETTALTENVLFRPPYKDFWKNKILLIEDLDGSYKALLPLREFMSNQYISKLANDPNPKTGKYEQVTLEASGPIVIAGATTKDRVYEDNASRSFSLHVNESKSHQDEILNFQNKLAAGLVDNTGIEKTVHKIQNIQRLLSSKIKVVNPFQPELKLPEYVFKKLRTNTHYITLIKAITFLHQYQRRHQKNPTTGETFIQTTLEDIALAN